MKIRHLGVSFRAKRTAAIVGLVWSRGRAPYSIVYPALGTFSAGQPLSFRKARQFSALLPRNRTTPEAQVQAACFPDRQHCAKTQHCYPLFMQIGF